MAVRPVGIRCRAVYDVGKAGDFYYFVMEYVDGANLRQVLRDGKLRPDQALQSSSPGEFHPQALTEPDGKLAASSGSYHPAPGETIRNYVPATSSSP